MLPFGNSTFWNFLPELLGSKEGVTAPADCDLGEVDCLEPTEGVPGSFIGLFKPGLNERLFSCCSRFASPMDSARPAELPDLLRDPLPIESCEWDRERDGES